MAYTFDGINKLIILSSGTTYVSVADMYSRWKEWVFAGNANFLQAMSYIGSDPVPGGQLGTTFFLENGWKIKPYEGNHTLTIVGNIYSRDGSDTTVNTVGAFNVRIINVVSTLVETVSIGGVGTVEEVRNAVWSDTNFASHGVGTAGAKLDSAGNSGDPWATDLSSYSTGTAGHKLYNQPTKEQIAGEVRNELTPELTHILTLENNPGLTTNQATMLLELYQIFGLDPTKPLVVTNTSRTAGDINQLIDTNDDRTILNRV